MTETFWIDRSGERVRLVAEGELDLANASAFCDALTVMFAVGRAVEIDLGRVTFVDAASVGVIAHAAREAGTTGTDLTITGASAAVARVFSLCDAASILTQGLDDGRDIQAPPPTEVTIGPGSGESRLERDVCSADPERAEAGGSLVCAPDELDWESAVPFVVEAGQAVRHAVSARVRCLVFDMGATVWLDSDGLRALIQSTTYAADAGLTVRTTRVNTTVRRIIELAALSEFLGVA
jgi:anti-anti-sigma factor